MLSLQGAGLNALHNRANRNKEEWFDSNIAIRVRCKKIIKDSVRTGQTNCTQHKRQQIHKSKRERNSNKIEVSACCPGYSYVYVSSYLRVDSSRVFMLSRLSNSGPQQQQQHTLGNRARLQLQKTSQSLPIESMIWVRSWTELNFTSAFPMQSLLSAWQMHLSHSVLVRSQWPVASAEWQWFRVENWSRAQIFSYNPKVCIYVIGKFNSSSQIYTACTPMLMHNTLEIKAFPTVQ